MRSQKGARRQKEPVVGGIYLVPKMRVSTACPENARLASDGVAFPIFWAYRRAPCNASLNMLTWPTL